MTCKDCRFRVDRCCRVTGDIVADFKLSTLKGHVIGIDEENTNDYYRNICIYYYIREQIE
jgi:hypothetical protein